MGMSNHIWTCRHKIANYVLVGICNRECTLYRRNWSVCVGVGAIRNSWKGNLRAASPSACSHVSMLRRTTRRDMHERRA